MLAYFEKFEKTLFVIPLLIVLTLISYYPSFDNAFVLWDDQFYVTDNPFIQSPTWGNFKVLLTKIVSLNYHPITMTSLWLNALFSGIESATPYILTNVFFHICNSILVYIFISRLIKNNFIALITALLFSLHPMHVESVAWVSERKDVLYVFFLLLSLINYINYRLKKLKPQYLLAILFFMFACLSKAMAVSLVPILCLVDYFYFSDKNKSIFKFLKPLIPFGLIAVFFGIIAINAQSGGDFYGIFSQSEEAVALDSSIEFGIFEKITHACYAIYFYLIKFVFPLNLCAFHPYGLVLDISYISFLPLLFAVILIAFLYFFRNHKTIIFGLSFFFASIFHVLQFIKVGSAIVAERYAYLPYVGLGIILAYGLNMLRLKAPKLSYTLLGLITIIMVYLTRQQVDTWQNHTSLFGNVIDIYPTSGQAHHIYATGLWAEKETQKAIEHERHAIDNLNFVRSEAFDLLGNCYADIQEFEKALAFYNQAISLDPNNYHSLYHRGIFIVENYQNLPFSALNMALNDFNKVESSNVDMLKPLLYGPRGKVNGFLSNFEQAVLDFTRAIEYEQDLKYNYFDRGITFELMGQGQKALQDFQTALTLDPNMASAKERVQAYSLKSDQ